MGACSCFSNSNPSEPVELSLEARTTLEKSLAKKSVHYLQTELTVLSFSEKFKTKLQALPPFKYDEKYPEFSDSINNPHVFRTNFNDLFQSSWKNGQPNGPGCLLSDKEEFYYEGYLKEAEPYKKGRLLTKNLEIYEGNFKSGRLNLEGTYCDNEGLTIKGTFVNGLIEGFGEEKWENGTNFSGNYINGVKNGKGTLIWDNENKNKEEKYDGEFVDNLFEGKGEYKWGTQKQYIGTWVKGMMDGEGTFTWKDGRIFKGKFKEDKKNGYGVLEWSDGRTWKGEWKDDKQDGLGYLTNSNGELQIGIWDAGKRVKWITEEDAKEYKEKQK